MPAFDIPLRPTYVQAIISALERVFRTGWHADRAIREQFKANALWSGEEQAFVVTAFYDTIRYYRLLHTIIGKEPVASEDWWPLFGALLILQGRKLPGWQEFKGLDAASLANRYAKLKGQRAFRESIPDWLDALGEQELGDRWDNILQALNQSPPTVIRANRLKTTVEELKSLLWKESIGVRPLGGEALWVETPANIFRTQAFRAGLFEVQDFNSQQVALFLDVQPGMRVIDACAGAGGKTLHLAALMQNKGQLIALDTEDWKLEDLRRRARRAGAGGIDTRLINSSKIIKRLDSSADRLLLDVPCSGLGVLRRNPDAKWSLQPDYLERLRELQQSILQSYCRMCKPGGKMVYATCSILPSENEAQIKQFLDQKGDAFNLLEMQTLAPDRTGFDGFFVAVFERKA